MLHLVLSAITQWVITTGTALAAAATDERLTTIEVVVSVLGGAVGAAKDVQAHLDQIVPVMRRFRAKRTPNPPAAPL